MISSAFKAVPFALMMAMSGCSADHDGIREGQEIDLRDLTKCWADKAEFLEACKIGDRFLHDGKLALKDGLIFLPKHTKIRVVNSLPPQGARVRILTGRDADEVGWIRAADLGTDAR